MNVHTFRDAVTSRRTALANDVEDQEEDEDREVGVLRRAVEGEEEESAEKFNEDGVPIEPFNLRNEREGGYFDENENYVFKKEVGEVDAWVSGLDEATIEAAIGEAALAEKRRALKRQLEEEKEEQSVQKTPLELKVELLTYMQSGETIASCLRRLSGRNLITTSSDLKGARRRPTASDQSTSKLTKKEEQAKQMAIAKQNRIFIDRVTEIADRLIASGLTGIYNMSYESIKVSTVLWEYKGADGIVYGPYTSQQISEWKAQGYLTGSTAVMIRKVKHDVSTLKRDHQEVATKAKKITSIYDDEEEEEEDNNVQAAKKAKTSEESSTTTSTSTTQNQGQPDDQYAEWMNSDEIDFGEFVNLEEEQARLSSGKSSGAEKIQSSKRNSNKYNYNQGEDDDDEDDDDEGDDHHGRNSRRKFEEEDEDEDD